jgi:hypothetical protein
MENLYRDGLAEEQTYLRKEREYELLRSIIVKRYPALPVIPNVIKASGDRSLETRVITFRQQCQIVDFYHSGNINGTFVRNYESVYSFLSETVHVSPRGINALFSRNADGHYSVDISGGQNRRLLIIIMINAFLYHYDLMKNYNSSISRNRELLPVELKRYRRRLVNLAKQVAAS